MKKKENAEPGGKRSDTDPQDDPEGYPLYPPSEDIYSQFKEEQDIDPEDPTRLKEDVPEPELEGEDDLVPELDLDIMGTDLDVPGADLDDENEDIGNEDEENNYYSIGGDNPHDLDEDNGEIEE